MQRWLKLVFGLLATMVMFASQAQPPIKIRHSQGELVLPQVPKRVVALEFSFVDALVSVGVPPVGIADDKTPDRIIAPLREAVKGYQSVGSRYQPSLEAIASLKPDLILADQRLHGVIWRELTAIAPTLLVESRTSYQEELDAMRLIGQAVGRETRMAQRLAEHTRTMNRLAEEIRNGGKLNAALAISSDKGTWLHTETTYAATLLQRLGFPSPLKGQRSAAWAEPYAKVGLEQMLSVNPDVVLLGRYSTPSQVDTWSTSPLWQAVSAVKHQRVYPVDGNLWARARGLISAELMATQLRDALR